MKEPTIIAHVMSDRYFERREKQRLDNLRDLKRFLPYFQRYPGPVLQMDLSEYRREFPDFPARHVGYLKGKRTLLRKAGVIP